MADATKSPGRAGDEDHYDPYAVRQPARERAGRALKPGAGTDDEAGGPQTVAAGQLRAFIERVERLEEEKKTIGDGYGAVEGAPPPMAGVPDWIVGYNVTYGGKGFDTKAVRTIVKLRRMDEAERQEAEAILDLYKSALGMA